MTTKAGCECIAHVLQGLTELEATITSIDGVGAFDLISESSEAVLFARMFMDKHQSACGRVCPREKAESREMQ